jgi:outer membrane protein TolC
MAIAENRARFFLLGCAALLFLTPPPPVQALTIEEAVDLALAQNERPKAADEEARAAEARVGRARAFFFPDLTVTGDYTRRSHETTRTVDGETTTLQSRDGWEARALVTQTLFDAQGFPLLAQAKRERNAARYEALDAKRRLAYETSEAFLSVLADDQFARAASQRVDFARQSLDEIRVRFEAQLVGSNDVTRAELEAASAERELVRLEGAARTSRLHLEFLLGQPIEGELVAPRNLLDLAVQPAAPSGKAAEQRLDYLAEGERAEALRQSAKEPAMRYLPDLEFRGEAWSTNESGFNARNEDWNMGLGLSWDLFDGGEREAEHGERKAIARQAQWNLANQERSVDVDVETAQVSLESEQASLTRSEVAVAAAERNAREVAELYRQGLVRALELVDANFQLFNAQVERTNAQYSLAVAYLGFRAAEGLDPFEKEAAP